ncbi:MAG: hypothetical protein HOM71_08400 [Deltaproteobacteria bacterium]|nr:hypothetical protein [Deltaproteobacteria bacterium]
MATDRAKPKRGVMMDIFLEDSVEKQIKEIQKVENLQDERDVIYRAIQNYFEKVTKSKMITGSTEFEKTNNTGFDGEVDFSHLSNILKNIETDNLIERLPQNDIYGLDGAGIIWIFHNRMLPVKFSLLCLSQMILEQNDPWVDLDDLKKYVQDSAQNFVDRFDNFPDIKNNFGVTTGFPRSFSSIQNTDGSLDNDKTLLSHYRSKKRFSEQFVGRKLRLRQIQNQRMLSEGYCIGGACFEMDLIHAKSAYKNNKEQNPDSSSKIKERIVVTLNERGLKFAQLKNNLMDFVYGHSATEPVKIFSDDEKNFYLNEILPRFEFENDFVRGLIKGGTIESSKYLKTVFEEKYMEFLKMKFPDKALPPHMQSSVTFRIRALVIMARLIEFGIFKKKPGTKSGPYILQQT